MIGLWACGIGRIGFGDPWGGITSMMAAIAGTFMLREDPTISKASDICFPSSLQNSQNYYPTPPECAKNVGD